MVLFHHALKGLTAHSSLNGTVFNTTIERIQCLIRVSVQVVSFVWTKECVITLPNPGKARKVNWNGIRDRCHCEIGIGCKHLLGVEMISSSSS